MEKSQGEANAVHLESIEISYSSLSHSRRTYRQNAIALLPFAVHFDIVEAPLLYLPYGQIRLHDPSEDGVESKDELNANESRRRASAYKSLTANPTRVAIDELQLQDLKNMDAVTYDQTGATLVVDWFDRPAVDVQKNANPAKQDVAMDVSPPAMGKDMRRPMVVVVGVQRQAAAGQNPFRRRGTT